MQIEYEATFYPVNKQDARERLIKMGAELERTEYLQKRHVFLMPTGHEIKVVG